MIVETLEAIQQITYPHQTYLCDEADDPYLKEVCAALNVRHVTRQNRVDAKAGNINNALKQATGDLCVVLDPDHVPAPDFLDPIVPHFADPSIGFVQIVQAYKNLDDGLIAKGAAQQTFQFYGPMMMSMNAYGTVMAIGANCTFRRAALDSIGGHAAGLAEDMHTAMQLHAKGWRSVYVPAVLSRGLVPSTLSAYYKQQLKWARGTFELLVTTYPKLFKKFTWRQKLHYGTIPFHYFSGVIYLINFLIPIFSLLFAVIPLKADLIRFGLFGVPVLVSSVLIRHYVQRWVMEEKERGFHVVGGLLLIGTWWIHTLGLIFTIVRKKVPYDPTPKDGSDPNNWRLTIPNITIGLLSIGAIIYGLSYDLNPYSLIMAGIAALNCSFMAFLVLASRQASIRVLKERYASLERTISLIRQPKIWLWHLRHTLYSGMRKLALPVVLLVTVACVIDLRYDPEQMPYGDTNQPAPTRHNPRYIGLFSPATAGGITPLTQVRQFQNDTQRHIDIVSQYVSWGDGPANFIPFNILNAIYGNNSIPMITWEPWGSAFSKLKNNQSPEDKIFQRISAGVFDDYLKQFALDVKSLKKPLFLRFAHEPDNPAYPWSRTGHNTPDDYKKGWKHVRAIFDSVGVDNVVWVWNPWKPEAVTEYFPGLEQVDWLAVTCLNYGPLHPDKKWYSFKELYEPFHKTPVFQLGLPVMIAEMGSLLSAGRQNEWLQEASTAIREDYKEVSAFVFFNSGVDKNVPSDTTLEALDWRINNPAVVKTISTQFWQNTKDALYREEPVVSRSRASIANLPTHQLSSFRGINYTKGQSWFRNIHTLTRHELEKDFGQMMALGITTIKTAGPKVYDRNILAVAQEMGLRVHYSFSIPTDLTYLGDNEADKKPAEVAENIAKTVYKLKDNPTIVAWNIGSAPIESINRSFIKPESFYQREAYMNWARTVIIKIKELDPSRPVTIDIEADKSVTATLDLFHKAIPEADAFGIVVPTDYANLGELTTSKVPYFFSKISVSQYQKLQTKTSAVFISDWQDTRTSDQVTFDGLLDHWGRKKADYLTLSSLWAKTRAASDLAMPRIKILKPVNTGFTESSSTFHALIYSKGQWRLAKPADSPLHYNWYLIKKDKFGHPVSWREVGSGTQLSISLTPNLSSYLLYLVASDNNYSEGVLTTPGL
jgi:hypothetical protein